jgi:AraC family transcriptional regulator
MNAKEKSRQEYIARINRVMDYIEKHYNEEITLDRIAQIACFSQSKKER